VDDACGNPCLQLLELGPDGVMTGDMIRYGICKVVDIYPAHF
jgi:hypothetical protein